MAHVLVVDDDPHIVDVITFALKKSGFSYVTAHDGKQAMTLFNPSAFDIIILDVGMPEIDGLEVCREIRKTSDIPILFLSARNDEIDRILGLEIGGDDYVTKPFSPRELIARINVILKRSSLNPQVEAAGEKDFLTCGQLILDPGHRSVQFDGATIAFTTIEFNILATLLGQPRQVFTREQLLNAAWPPNIHVSDRTIDSHVRNLRAKLADAGCENGVETVHGFGFRLGTCM